MKDNTKDMAAWGTFYGLIQIECQCAIVLVQ